MKVEHFRIGILICSLIASISLYLLAENNKYTIVAARIPEGTRFGTAGQVSDRPLETIIRLNTRTGEAEYYYDLSLSTPLEIKIARGWTELANQKVESKRQK